MGNAAVGLFRLCQLDPLMGVYIPSCQVLMFFNVFIIFLGYSVRIFFYYKTTMD